MGENIMQNGEVESRLVIEIGDPLGFGTGNIVASDMSHEEKQAYTETVRECLVKIESGTPSCCIDGRGCVACLDGKPSGPRPAVAGGAQITAYGGAELAGYFTEDDPRSTLERYMRVAKTLDEGGYPLSGHCDTKAKLTGFASGTGCGANNKFQVILNDVYNFEPQVLRTSNILYRAIQVGNGGSSALKLVDKAHALKSVKGWDPTFVLEQMPPAHVEELESKATPTGGHAEDFLIVINRPGYTVDRQKLLEKTGRQGFVLTTWYVSVLADTLAQTSRTGSDVEQLKFGMLAYNVATSATLTDGSQTTIYVS